MGESKPGVPSSPTTGKQEQPQQYMDVPSMPFEPTLGIRPSPSIPTPISIRESIEKYISKLHVAIARMSPSEITAQIKDLMTQLADERIYEKGGARPPMIMSSQQFAETIEKAVKKAGLTPEQQQELQSQVDQERKSNEEKQRLLAEERSRQPRLASRLIT